jgi:hypothetical protein
VGFRNELQMSEAVARHFKNSAREVRVGNCILDVVAYDKEQKLFSVIECKLGSTVTRISETFGQIAGYQAELSARPHTFIDAFTDKPEVHLRWGRLMEATSGNRYIRVAFYVALTDEACAGIDLIRSHKQNHLNVGVIRVKEDGSCKDNLKADGRRDLELAKAIPTVITILQERSDKPVGAIVETA